MADTATGLTGPPRHTVGQVRLRLALALLWLVAVGATLLLYERERRIDYLYAAVAAGDVDSVHLVGGLPPGSSGSSSVRAEWRDGWFAYTASAYEVAPGSKLPVNPDGEVVLTPVRATLAQLESTVTVDQEEYRGGLTFVGDNIPTWLGATLLAGWLGLLFFLVNGPVPWRATRWAWFWLILSPLGQLAYLLLSGPTPGWPRPRRPERPLTGGWGFLLGVLLSSFSLPGWVW